MAQLEKEVLKGRVSELIGYWDDDDQYVEKVNSYNRMDTDLDAR